MLKRQSGISSLGDQQKMVITRIGELQRNIDENKSELAATRMKASLLKQLLSDVPQLLDSEKVAGNVHMHNEFYKL